MSNINSFLHPLDFIVVLLYIFILIALGYYISFIKKRKSDDNIFLAGRSLKWYSIGLTMWGTNVGPSMLIASCSIGFTTGIVAGNFAWYAFIFIFLLAVVFAPRYLQEKVSTLPEFMGRKFGDRTRNILAWYSIITILISWLSLTLFAGGIVFSQILNVPLWVSVILLVVISAFFTVAGGLEAIAFTNVFQMILLIVVSAVLVIVGLIKVGGPLALYHATPHHYWNLLMPANDPNYPWPAIILGYPVMGVWFWCTDQSMVQSVLGAKNLKQGQFGANFTGWLKILDVALFILPGIMCYVLFPHLKDPDAAYMTMVTRLLPTGVVGLVMAVIIAALVSTIDSALNSLSTVFTMDIYIKRRKPDASQKEIIRIGRIVTLVGAVIAIMLTLAINAIKGMNLFDIFQSILGFIAPPMTAVFLSAVLWRKTTTKAINIALIAGTLLSLITGVLYLWVFPANTYHFWPHFLLLSFYLYLIIQAMIVIVSLTDKRKIALAETKVSKTFSLSNIPAREWWAWGALFVVMTGFYILFDGHGGKGAHKTQAFGNEQPATKKPVIVEVAGQVGDSLNPQAALSVCQTNALPENDVYQWKNHIVLYDSLEEPQVIKEQLSKKYPDCHVLVYDDIYYDFERKDCAGKNDIARHWDHILLTASLVKDTALQHEYLQLHKRQFKDWPEVAQGFCHADFQQLLGFRNGRRLMLVISIPHGADFDQLNALTTKNNPKEVEWNKMMAKYQVGVPGTKAGQSWVFLRPAK